MVGLETGIPLSLARCVSQKGRNVIEAMYILRDVCMYEYSRPRNFFPVVSRRYQGAQISILQRGSFHLLETGVVSGNGRSHSRGELSRLSDDLLSGEQTLRPIAVRTHWILPKDIEPRFPYRDSTERGLWRRRAQERRHIHQSRPR